MLTGFLPIYPMTKKNGYSRLILQQHLSFCAWPVNVAGATKDRVLAGRLSVTDEQYLQSAAVVPSGPSPSGHNDNSVFQQPPAVCLRGSRLNGDTITTYRRRPRLGRLTTEIGHLQPQWAVCRLGTDCRHSTTHASSLSERTCWAR